MNVLEIFIFRGDQLIGSRVFSESAVTIGRGNAALLRLDDKQVSRLHATILIDGARLVVRDEGSQIGTLLNGQRVREQSLREVDSVQVGPFRLKVTRRTVAGPSDFAEEEPTDAGQRRGPGPAEERPGVISLGEPRQAPVAPVVVVTTSRPARDDDVTIPVTTHRAPPSRPEGRPDIAPTQAPQALPITPPAPVSRPSSVTPSRQDSSLEELTAGLEDSIIRTFTSEPAREPIREPATPLPMPAPAFSPPSAEPEDATAEFEQEPQTVRRVSGAGPIPLALALAPLPAPMPSEITPIVLSAPAQDPAAAATDPAPADGPPGADTDDDEEEDEEPFVSSFSLLEMLDTDPMLQGHPGAPVHLEIIEHRDGQVLDVQQIGRQQNFPAVGRRLLRLDAEGRAQLAITEDVGGHVTLSKRQISLEEIRRGAKDRKGVALLELREGDHAAVVMTRPSAGPNAAPIVSHYHIRFVRMPEYKREQAHVARDLLAALKNRLFWGSVALHGLILFGLTLLPPSDAQAVAEEARFAEVSLKSIQLEPPPEVKPPEPEPEPEPPTKPAEVVMPKVVRPTRTVRVRTRTPSQPQAAQSALAALESIKPEGAPAPAIKDVVTNINAVSVPSDVRSRFKVGGAIGKLPVGDVRVSTAGAARDSTSSGRELLSKESVGAIKAQSGNVRGVVKQAPPAALQTAGSGRLSRAQITKVVNEHAAQIQACYEKALIRDRALSGKITFDWEISPSGSVTGVRVRSSTMAGSDVSSCVLQQIRTWTFPTPEGGAVSVTYPFIFSAQGY